MERQKVANLLLTTIAVQLSIVIFLIMTPPKPVISVKGLAIAQRSYVALESRNKQNQAVTRASGVRLNGKFILSCAHIFKEGERVFSEGEMLRLISLDKERDLALFKINAIEDSAPIVMVAQSISRGEGVFDCSNADGNSGTVNFYLVKYSNDEILHLDKPIIPGESGAGVFNSEGKLIGVYAATQRVFFINQPENFVNYGLAIGPKTLVEFLSGVRDKDFDKYYTQAVVQTWFDRIMWRFYPLM